MFLKLNSLYPDFGLHDSWPFCHALFSRKFLFIFSITCLTFYSWSFQFSFSFLSVCIVTSVSRPPETSGGYRYPAAFLLHKNDAPRASAKGLLLSFLSKWRRCIRFAAAAAILSLYFD